MASTVSINGLGVITDAESITNWGKTGLISNPVAETDLVLQGSGAVSSKASAKAGWLYYDYGSGLDFTTTYVGQHVFIWINVTTLGGLNNLANQGLAIQLGTTTSDYAYWTIGGSDGIGNNYTGGWLCCVIDPTSTPTGTSGTWDNTSIRYFGVYIDNTGSAKSENLIIDTIAIANGLYITGTSTNGWKDVADYCNDYTNRAWGMFQIGASGAYRPFGNIGIGATGQTSNSSLIDEGRLLVWGSFEYYNGSSWVSAISNTFNKLEVVDNATYTTTFKDGVKVGTDEGRSGSLFSADGFFTVNLAPASNAGSLVQLYGSRFLGVDYGITLKNDSDHEFFGVTFESCGQVDPGGACKIRNCLFVSTTETNPKADAAIAFDASGPTYTDQTTAANNATVDDMTLLPATPAVGDIYYFGGEARYGALLVWVSTAGAGNVLAWEYWNGASWATPSGLQDDTSNFNTAGVNFVGWTIPSDWKPTTINGQGPFYFIRARLTTAGTQALGALAWAYMGGAALKWVSGIDIQDCKFIANSSDDWDPAGILHNTAGSFNYTGLEFSGNDYDIINSSAAALLDSYAETNQDGQTQIYSGSVVGAGQSFTGDGTKLARGRFYLRKVGSPTGNAVAKIYLSDGGSPAAPTGSALATSNNFDVSTLSTVFNIEDFEFEDEFTLVNTTSYFIVVEYSGGDSSNRIEFGYDGSSPTHGGNYATLTGTTWTGDATKDGVFYVQTGGIVKVNALTSSDPGSAIEVGNVVADEDRGATIIVLSVSYTLTGLIATSEVRIYEKGVDINDAGDEIDGVESSSTSFVHSYNYPGSPQDIIVVVFKEDYKPIRFLDSLTASDKSVPVFQIPAPNYSNP